MKQFYSNRRIGKSQSRLFLRLFMLIAMSAIGMSSLYATETEIFRVVFNYETSGSALQATKTPTESPITATAVGVSSSDNNTEVIDGIKYLKINNDPATKYSESKSCFKLAFSNGAVQAGDILKIGVLSKDANKNVGFRINGTDTPPYSGTVDQNVPYTVEHTITSDEAGSGTLWIERISEASHLRYNNIAIYRNVTIPTLTPAPTIVKEWKDFHLCNPLDETNWTKENNDRYSTKSSDENTYVTATNGETEYSNTKDLEFGKKVALVKAYYDNGNPIDIQGLWIRYGGKVKIPVQKGDVLDFSLRGFKTDLDAKISYLNTNNEVIADVEQSFTAKNADFSTYTYKYIAKESGFMILEQTEENANWIIVRSITKLSSYTFGFKDGDEIPATNGSTGYFNELSFDPNAVPDNYTITWASGNPGIVNVDSETGVISVDENVNFNGLVTIYATMSADGYPSVTKSYNVRVRGNISFTSPASNWSLENGTKSGKLYLSDDSQEENVKYTIESTTPETPGGAISAVVSPLDGVDEFGCNLTITGKGLVVVKATCGLLSATHTVNTSDFVFTNTKPVYNFNNTTDKDDGTYEQDIPGYTDAMFEIVEAYGAIKDHVKIGKGPQDAGDKAYIDGHTIRKLPSYDKNYGGAIVVKATRGEGVNTQNVFYTLTIPYKERVWNFYKEYSNFGEPDTAEGDPVAKGLNEPESIHSPLKLGPLAGVVWSENENDNGTEDGCLLNPGAADCVGLYGDNDEVIALNETKHPYEIPSDDADGKKLNALLTNLSRMSQWEKLQADNNYEGKYGYWDYGFKTHSFTADRRKTTYTNEPIFKFRGVVNGDNARLVRNTAGLVIEAAYGRFAINDNRNTSTHTYKEKDGQVTTDIDEYALNTREKDRAVILQQGSTLTIPRVTQGHYVKLHWYRHSDNAGDKFRVTNAQDLDGHDINPNHVLQFTGSEYYKREVSAYKGCTFLRAKTTGDITITFEHGWTELYRIEVTDKFDTELKVIVGKVEATNKFGWGANTMHDYKEENIKDMNERSIAVVRYVNDDAVLRDEDLGEERREKDDKTKMIQNNAKLATREFGYEFGENRSPIIYISSYPGTCYTWNGWRLDVEVTHVDGTLQQPTVKNLWTHVGNNAQYRMTAVTNFKGTGVAHVVVRTKSNPDSDRDADKNSATYTEGNMRYTLDMQEAYFPVGEYHAQDYPYTWDFTASNMTLADGEVDPSKRYGETSHGGATTADLIGGSEEAKYGDWSDSKLKTVTRVRTTVPACDKSTNKQEYYNKYLFADGAELVANYSENNISYLREAEGLRVQFSNDNAEHFVENDAAGSGKKVEMNTSNYWLSVPGTITLPHVDHNMYIFVKSEKKPKAVKFKSNEEWLDAADLRTDKKEDIICEVYDNFGAYADNPVQATLKVGDLADNVWVYRIKPKGVTIGSPDNKTGFFGEKTDSRTVNPGEAAHVTFKNYSSKGAIWNNLLLVTHAVGDRDVNSEHFCLRADRCAWDAGVKDYDASSFVHEYNNNVFQPVPVDPNADDPYKNDRKSFMEDMDGAYVDMRIYLNESNQIISESVITTTSGKKYNYKFTSDAISTESAEPFDFYFTVDNSHIEDFNVSIINKSTALAEDYNKSDVCITTNDDNHHVEMIGVTDEFKMMTNETGWATDSRLLRVNYDYSGVFTEKALKANIVHTPRKFTNCGHTDNGEVCEWCGKLTFKPVSKVKGWQGFRNNNTNSKGEYEGEGTYENAGVNTGDHKPRGLVVKEYKASDPETWETYTPSQEGRSLIPLFVPANNQVYDEIGENILVDVVNTGHVIPATTPEAQTYILTNQFFDWDGENGISNGKTVPVNFYILKIAGDSRSNAAYLKLDARTVPFESNEVRKFYLFEEEDQDLSGIDEIETDDSKTVGELVESGAEVYTLSGVKLNGLPTAKGIYIINGKKLLVK